MLPLLEQKFEPQIENLFTVDLDLHMYLGP